MALSPQLPPTLLNTLAHGPPPQLCRWPGMLHLAPPSHPTCTFSSGVQNAWALLVFWGIPELTDRSSPCHRHDAWGPAASQVHVQAQRSEHHVRKNPCKLPARSDVHCPPLALLWAEGSTLAHFAHKEMEAHTVGRSHGQG